MMDDNTIQKYKQIFDSYKTFPCNENEMTNRNNQVNLIGKVYRNREGKVIANGVPYDRMPNEQINSFAKNMWKTACSPKMQKEYKRLDDLVKDQYEPYAQPRDIEEEFYNYMTSLQNYIANNEDNQFDEHIKAHQYRIEDIIDSMYQKKKEPMKSQYHQLIHQHGLASKYDIESSYKKDKQDSNK